LAIDLKRENPDRSGHAVEQGGAFNKNSQRQKKRTALLNEALKMINDRGATAVSLDDLAANLDISKGTVYYYFKNKDELLFECYSASFDVWEEALDIADAQGQSGREKIELYVRNYLNEGLGALRAIIYLRGISALNGAYRDDIESRRQRLRDRVRGFVLEGNRDGSLRTVDDKIAVTVIGASITWLLRAYRPTGSLSRERYLEEAVSIITRGIVSDAPDLKPADASRS